MAELRILFRDMQVVVRINTICLMAIFSTTQYIYAIQECGIAFRRLTVRSAIALALLDNEQLRQVPLSEE